VKLINPLSSDLGVLRQTLLFGGLESICPQCQPSECGNLRFFEYGNCYYFDESKRNAEKVLSCYSEDYHLGLWLTGKKVSVNSWAHPDERLLSIELKAYVENILKRAGVKRNELYDQSCCR
jgi:phenylalanyl-tRNA synthetase beta chain